MLENTRKALNEKDINMDITKKAKKLSFTTNELIT